MTEEVLSLKAFAVLLGVQPSYVTKLKQAGRLVLTEGGRVRVEASRRRIAETAGAHHDGVREHWRERRAGAPAAGGEGAPQMPEAAREEAGAADLRADSTAYWNRREAAARAQLREMELAEKEGKLVDADVVRRAGEEMGALLRAALENLPDQLAPVLVGVNDEIKVHALLVERIEVVLGDVANKLSKVGELRSPPAGDPR